MGLHLPISRRSFGVWTLSATAAAVSVTIPLDDAAAEILSTDEALATRVLGSDDAPITMIEYSSLGCPHCMAFHRDTLPQLKKDYIDTGKVRLEYRDFPLGTRALAAAMITRCAPKERYFGMVELMFQNQSDWSQSPNPIESLTRVAKFGGLSGSDVEACLQNEDLIEGIRSRAEAGSDEHNVEATPTFILQPSGRKIEGNQPYEAFRAALDEELV